jgi:hypothetical protein
MCFPAIGLNRFPDELSVLLMGGRSHFGGGATTNSGVSVTLALMEFAMKHWA